MGKLSVYRKGQQLLAGDTDSGNNLLYVLNIPLDPEHQIQKDYGKWPGAYFEAMTSKNRIIFF